MLDRLRHAMAFQLPPAALLRTLETGQKLVYADIGARDDIGYPWNAIPTHQLRVIGFEPDSTEIEVLEGRYPNRIYKPYALWSGTERRPLYINRSAASSSLYPANESANAMYATHRNGERTLDRIIEVECRALDTLISKEEDIPDIIKIDTQGAEWEILRGARRLLTENAPVVTAETWCAEVYKGAPLDYDVIALMWELGYQILDSSVAAAWTYHAPVSYVRPRTVGFNYLFVKRLEYLGALEPTRLAQFCYLMELYGHRDYAWTVLERHQTVDDARRNRLMKSLIGNDVAENWKPGRIARKVLRALGHGKPRYPAIT